MPPSARPQIFVLLCIVSILLSCHLSPFFSLWLHLSFYLSCFLSFPSATSDIVFASLTFSSLSIILVLCGCLSPPCPFLQLDLQCLIRVWPKQWTYCFASGRGPQAAGHVSVCVVCCVLCLCVWSQKHGGDSSVSRREGVLPTDWLKEKRKGKWEGDKQRNGAPHTCQLLSIEISPCISLF